MSWRNAVTAVAATAMMVGSAGCFRSTKLVNRTTLPDVYRSAGVEEIEREVSARDASIHTLNANVLITAAEGGGRTGKVETYTSVKGYIFLRKPGDLRVILQLPVLGSRAMDMVSNGKTFTLVYASPTHGDTWVEGSNATPPDVKGLKSLRPPVFFDSLLVPKVNESQSVSMTESTRILPSPTKKRVDIEEPDYDLTVTEPKSAGVLRTVRVLHISRTNMLPYQQDIYDESGQVVTTAMYANYQKINGVDFPMLINISRPLDELKLKVQITKLTLNETLADDQFELKAPEGAKVEKLP